MYIIFQKPLLLNYKASLVSKATVFYLLSTLLTFIPPLLVTYRSQGFWKKLDYYEEQPEINFEQDLVVLLHTDRARIGWSSFDNLNQLLLDSLRIPTVQTRQEDSNRDGLPDGLELQLDMPLSPEDSVYSVQLLLLFDVRLQKFSRVNLKGMAFVNEGTVIPGVTLDVVSDLVLVQKEPLPHKGRDHRFAQPIFPDVDSIFAEDYDLVAILKNYQSRNLTVRMENSYSLWQTGNAAKDKFVINVRLNYLPQIISYRPGFWQMLKWAFVQYVSVLIVFIALFRQIKRFVFSKQILPTYPTFPPQDLKLLRP